LLGTVLGLNAQHAPVFAIKSISLTPRPTYVPLVAEVLAALVCLLAAFALVLLIACANLAGILLARGAARQREMAIRTALGASRGRLIRQLLTESVLICAIAAAPSLLLTLMGAGAIQARLFTLLTKEGYHLQPLSPDWRVFLFTAALALAAGIVLGLAPALGATRIDLADRMKAGAGTHPNSRPRRVREWLVTGQVAASLVLLVISGIFIRHLQRLDRADLGFDAGHVIDVRAGGPKRKLIQRLGEDPRFGTASEVYRTPVGAHGLFPLPARVDGHIWTLGYNYVDSQYFDVVGLPVRHGRRFTAQEARAQARFVVVSEATSRLLWPGKDPIGKTIEVLGAEGGERFAAGKCDVIGVVPDVVSGVLSGSRTARQSICRRRRATRATVVCLCAAGMPLRRPSPTSRRSAPKSTAWTHVSRSRSGRQPRGYVSRLSPPAAWRRDSALSASSLRASAFTAWLPLP
jgi:hypothetical protein